MRKFNYLLLAIPLFSLTSYSKNNSICNHDNNKLSCVDYIKNYDGDSYNFHIAGLHPLFGENLSYSLANVKTPNIRSKNKCEKDKAKKAKSLAKDALKNAKIIHLTNIQKSKSGKLSGEIIFDNKNLAKILTKKKLAIGKDKKNYNWCS